MADTPVSGNGNGRERFDGMIAGQKFTISVRDLLPILLLASGVLGGYLLYQQLAAAVRALSAQHALMEDRIVNNYKEFVRLLQVMEWNCTHDVENRLPLVLDHTILERKVPQVVPTPAQ